MMMYADKYIYSEFYPIKYLLAVSINKITNELKIINNFKGIFKKKFIKLKI
jgi:hypothetical protein